MTLLADAALSRRLERAEARANADFVETRARLEPLSGAAWTEVCGAYAMFDSVDSPCTQTFGLGMFDAVTDVDMERLEEFFTSRGAPVFHEVSPMAHPELLETLAGRGYRPIEMSAVLVRDLSGGESLNQRRSSNITTRVIGSGEVDIWASTSAAGWATEHESLGDFMLNFGKISANCRGSYPYIAEFEGKPVATGMMFVHEGVAILAGASTVPDGRNKGAQNALLFDRLAHAADLGCNMAMMAAAPGSQSQCNAQKNGFEIAYTRTKWQLST